MGENLPDPTPEPPPGEFLLYPSEDGRTKLRVRVQDRTQLRDLPVKGFVLDDERLEAGKSLGADYFDELLRRQGAARAGRRRAESFRFVNPAESGSRLHSARKSVGFEDRATYSPSV